MERVARIAGIVLAIWVTAVSANMGSMIFGVSESADISAETGELTHSRVLLSFDISGLPEEAVIWYAALRLVDEEGVPWEKEYVPVHVVPVTSSWDPETVTWDGPTSGEDWDIPGGDMDESRIASRVLLLKAGTPAKFVLTTTVREWHSGTRRNNGLIAIMQDIADLQDITQYFNAETLKPSLEIRYILPTTDAP